jgi:predicted PhzF superfamily epimerase YddE/YHI9
MRFVPVALLVRAFINADRTFGNPALVVVEPEGARVTAAQRQDLATRLGIPATVFVHDPASGSVSIHGSYGQEIRFGGHPLLATVEALHRLGTGRSAGPGVLQMVAHISDDDGTGRAVAVVVVVQPRGDLTRVSDLDMRPELGISGL